MPVKEASRKGLTAEDKKYMTAVENKSESNYDTLIKECTLARYILYPSRCATEELSIAYGSKHAIIIATVMGATIDLGKVAEPLLQDVELLHLLLRHAYRKVDIIKKIPKHLLNNKRFINIAIEEDLDVYMAASAKVRSDETLARKVLSLNKDIANTKYLYNSILCPKVKADHDIIFAIVNNNIHNIGSIDVPEEVLADIVLAKRILTMHPYALGYFPWAVKNNKEIAIMVMSKCIGQYANLSETLKKDKDIVNMVMVSKDKTMLLKLPHSLLHTKEIAIASVRVNADMFKVLPYIMRNDIEVATIAISTNGDLFEYTGDDIKDDESILDIALKTNNCAINYASDRIKLTRYVVKNYGI